MWDHALVILQRTKIGNYFVLNFNLYNCFLTEVLFICKFTGKFTAAGQIKTILQALKCLQNNIYIHKMRLGEDFVNVFSKPPNYGHRPLTVTRPWISKWPPLEVRLYFQNHFTYRTLYNVRRNVLFTIY